MANLSNINNKFIVDDGGNVLVGSTANLSTYTGISLYGANPSLAIKTSSGSGWIWTQYVNSSGTNNFSMGVNQSIPFWGVGAGAGMGGGTMDLVVDSSGNVGVGTYSPAGKFNSYISATRQLTHNGNGGDLSIISDNNSSPVMFIKGTGNADLLNVFDNTTEVFTILDGGNVGIGTASPDSKLEVAGQQAINWGITSSSANGLVTIGEASTTVGGSLFVRTPTHSTYYPGGFAVDGAYADIVDRKSTIKLHAYGVYASGWNADMAFYTSAGTGETEKMRIDSDGNVGIGVVPEAWTVFKTLQIGQASSFVGRISSNQTDVATNWYYDGAEKRIASGYAQRYTQTADGEHQWYTAGTGNADSAITFSQKLTIKNNGNVGIGVTNIGSAGLSLANNFNFNMSEGVNSSFLNIFRQSSSAATVIANGYKYSGNSNAFASSYPSNWAKTAIALNYGTIIFYTDTPATTASGTDVTPTERMRIDSSGNVGIGTDAPDAKFQVQGNIKVGSASGASWTDAKDDIGGLDVFVGSGSNAFSVWDDNAQTTPRFLVSRAGNVGVGGAAGVKFEVYSGSLRVRGYASDVIELSNTSGNTRAALGNTGNEGDLSLYRSNNSKYVYLSSYYNCYIDPQQSSAAVGIGGAGVGIASSGQGGNTTLDVQGPLRNKRVMRGWFHCGPITSSNAYRHIKTNLWMGGSPGNTEYIMGGFEAKGFAYYGSYPGFGHGTCMFHNWSGGFASLQVSNFGTAGFMQSPYVSSDGYCVIVLRQNTYMQPVIDFSQYYTPYPWRTSYVTAETTSNNLNGVY